MCFDLSLINHVERRDGKKSIEALHYKHIFSVECEMGLISRKSN